MKLEFFQQIFEKYSNIRFHENPSVGAELSLADVQTDMAKLIVAFCNFTNASLTYSQLFRSTVQCLLRRT